MYAAEATAAVLFELMLRRTRGVADAAGSTDRIADGVCVAPAICSGSGFRVS